MLISWVASTNKFEEKFIIHTKLANKFENRGNI